MTGNFFYRHFGRVVKAIDSNFISLDEKRFHPSIIFGCAGSNPAGVEFLVFVFSETIF